ncbi:dTDP-4-dehydrorhamnose reductase [Polynucleobacter duraquae]|uniref:dTDP-4-dehydrorhamnose reductase n=1 Tax=Polynucleobacter duraquae TaxID=1835254 RepID=A0A0E3ZK56_9BURK|nr:sugar nucleotide-binding protein [Polynucleobacter duraquae]AKD24666.1 dTDP-4-dehydrorhamnose reductase [Polynucleobacter duraquae]
MRVLILGTTGLIGRMLFTYLSLYSNNSIYGISRTKYFHPNESINLSITPFDFFTDTKKISNLLDSINPQVIINCAGITKHLSEINDTKRVEYMNRILPQNLSLICKQRNVRLIQVSTDCVFSGVKGGYTELDKPDGEGIYSTSKFAGEIDEPHLTVRISTVGPELNTKYGLLAWFMSCEDKCYGFRNAFFNGITSLEFSKIMNDIILPSPHLQGLFHISSNRISKYNLLRLFSIVLGKKIFIEANKTFIVDRTLSSTKFSLETNYIPKKFSKQLIELKQFLKEHTLYD